MRVEQAQKLVDEIHTLTGEITVKWANIYTIRTLETIKRKITELKDRFEK